MDPITTISGERLRQLRLAIGATQTDLNKQVAFDGNSMIAKIESGRGTANPETVAALARRLGCTPEFLASPPADLIATRPWLRAYADAPAKAVDSVLADNRLAHEVGDTLALRRIPESIPRFDGDLNDPDAIEQHAAVVRAAAGLDEGAVVRNAMRALERLGCTILPLPDELGRHLGLSQYVDGSPYVRVSRPRRNVPGDRQRFTVAHELGHLALHAHLGPPETPEDAREIENQAHRFAGAFLTPRDPLLEDLTTTGGRVTLNALSHLKSNWGVSIKMLVVRLTQLTVVESAQATALYKQISKRGWNSGEPIDVPTETPIWLSKALAKRWAGTDPVGRSAEASGLAASHLERWLDWTNAESKNDLATVVDFGSRRRGRDVKEAEARDAEVTHLRPR